MRRTIQHLIGKIAPESAQKGSFAMALFLVHLGVIAAISWVLTNDSDVDDRWGFNPERSNDWWSRTKIACCALEQSWFFSICELKQTEVVITNQSQETCFEEELAKDVLEIITVFSAQLYGSRSKKNQRLIDGMKKAVSDAELG